MLGCKVKVKSHSNRKLKTTNGYNTYYPKSVTLLSSSIPSLLPSVFIKLLYLQYLAENIQHPAVKICTIKSTDSKSTNHDIQLSKTCTTKSTDSKSTNHNGGPMENTNLQQGFTAHAAQSDSSTTMSRKMHNPSYLHRL